MTTRSLRCSLLSILLISLLLQGGCKTVPQATGENGGKPIVQKLIQSTRSWNGELLPPYPEGQPEITVMRIIIPPGSRLSMHKHPFINAGILAGGELTVVTKDGKTKEVKPGEALIEVVDTWHYGMNNGEAPVEIIVVYAGVENAPVTVLEAESAPSHK